MAVLLSPYGGVGAQFLDNSGNVLTGGKIFTYAAGTTTPQVTYTNSTGTTPHSNPIILDASGRVPSGEIWLTDGLVYKFVLKDSNDVLIATYDNIIGINSNFVNFSNQQEIQTATAGQTVFNLTTMSYQPGTNSLSVFVDGVNQYGPGSSYAYLETDSDTVTFVTGLHVGAEVKFSSSQLNSSAGGDAFNVSYLPPFTGSVGNNVGDKLAQTTNPQDFGAVGDGVTDDTTALTAFFTAIAGSNEPNGDIGDDSVYLFSQLVIPTNVSIRGRSVFRADSSLLGSVATITVQGTFSADTLHLTTAGTETNDNLIVFEGSDVSIQNLIVESDAQFGGTGGIVCRGSNYEIGNLKTVFVPRPIQFQKATSGLGAQTNIRLGNVDIYSYIRGISMTNCNNWSIEYANMRVADSRAAKTPGHNGILISSCQDFTIGEMYVADSGEHAFRIGGNTYGSDTARFSVNSITTRKTGGCAVKIAPVPDTCYDGSFGVITAIDTGRGTTTANNEPIRFTNANNVYVGSLVALASEFATSCHRVAILNSDINITIDSIHAENVSGRVIDIDETYDSGTGNFSGLYINACFATMASSPRSAFEIAYSSGGRTIGEVYIRNVNVSGYTTYLYENDTAITTTGVIFISGVTSLATVDSVTPITLDITFSGTGQRYVGSSSNLSNKAPFTVGAVQSFDIGTTPTSLGALFLNAANTSTSGDGNIGASLAFSRAGSSRRGAAIVTKQFGADVFNVGISFLPSASASAANEAVAEKMYLKPTGTLLLSGLLTYVDNAAALAGGLVAGDLYKTSGGEVRIVV